MVMPNLIKMCEHFNSSWETAMSYIENYCKRIINNETSEGRETIVINNETLKGHEMKDMIVKLDCLYSNSNGTLKYVNRMDEIKYNFKKGLELIPNAIQELENYKNGVDKIIEEQENEFKQKIEYIYDV